MPEITITLPEYLPWGEIIHRESTAGEDSHVLVGHHKQVPLCWVEPTQKIVLGNMFYGLKLCNECTVV